LNGNGNNYQYHIYIDHILKQISNIKVELIRNMKQMNIVFNVVINTEEQFSIWPNYKPLPSGWEKTGFEGSKENCLEEINNVWSDMRPASLKNAQK